MKEAEIGGKLQTAKKTWVSIYKENKDFRVGRVESRSLEWLIDEKHILANALRRVGASSFILNSYPLICDPRGQYMISSIHPFFHNTLA